MRPCGASGEGGRGLLGDQHGAFTNCLKPLLLPDYNGKKYSGIWPTSQRTQRTMTPCRRSAKKGRNIADAWKGFAIPWINCTSRRICHDLSPTQNARTSCYPGLVFQDQPTVHLRVGARAASAPGLSVLRRTFEADSASQRQDMLNHSVVLRIK
jgi:hypothetical protein